MHWLVNKKSFDNIKIHGMDVKNILQCTYVCLYVTRSILLIYSTSKDMFFKLMTHASLLSCRIWRDLKKKSKQHDEIFENKPKGCTTATENSSCFPANAIPVLDRQLLQHGLQKNNPIFRRCPLFTTRDRSRLCVFMCTGARAPDMSVTQITYTTLHRRISSLADSKHHYY